MRPKASGKLIVSLVLFQGGALLGALGTKRATPHGPLGPGMSHTEGPGGCKLPAGTDRHHEG